MADVFKSNVAFDVANICNELDTNGFVCLENIISDRWLTQARAGVETLIESEGAKYFSIIRPGDERGSSAEQLVNEPNFHAMMRDATARVCARGIGDFEETYNVLRIIAGPNGETASLGFHYDASVITALVPLFIPRNERYRSGELITFANQRPFRRSLLANLVEKIWLQNRFSQQSAVRRFWKNPAPHIQDLVPGNVYLFWGYRTYHANLPCESNSLRATMLVHYGNPHGNSLFLRGVRTVRRKIENRKKAIGRPVGGG